VTNKAISCALDLVNSQSSKMVDILSRLIALDTSFPPGKGYGPWADALEKILTPMGFVCDRVLVPEELWKNAGVEGGKNQFDSPTRHYWKLLINLLSQ
jgi:succinyl-diaminopimelate desuccinylase